MLPPDWWRPYQMPAAIAIAASDSTSLRSSLRFEDGLAVVFAGMNDPKEGLKILYHHSQSSRKHLKSLTVKGEDFAVHHDVHRGIEREINVPDGVARGERMIQVRAVIQRVQIAQQAQAADGAPAHEFDQAVIHFGARSDHHFPAGEFAVVEREKKTAARVGSGLAIEAQWKSAPVETGETGKQGEQVAEFAHALEAPHAGGGHVGRESHAEKVDVVDGAAPVIHAQDVAGALAAGKNRFFGVIFAAIGEIAQK